MSIHCRKLIFTARSKISSALIPRCYSQQVNGSNNFTADEENLIVNTINTLTVSDLKRYSINEIQVRKLLAHRDEKGKFETFDDLLTIQSVPSLIKLSKLIINGGKNIQDDTAAAAATATARPKIQTKNIVTPPIDSSTKAIIKSVVGLHIQLNTISWANLDVNSNNNINLTSWTSETFDNPSKSSLVPLVNSVINITSRLPNADAYVLEADSYISLSKIKPAQFAYHIQRQQAITTIISALAMRRRFKDDSSSAIHNFYMLQARSPARLFNLIIGSETVSADPIIADILSGKKIAQLPTLPSINVDSQIYDYYRGNDYETCKMMQSALLVTLAFANSLRL